MDIKFIPNILISNYYSSRTVLAMVAIIMIARIMINNIINISKEKVLRTNFEHNETCKFSQIISIGSGALSISSFLSFKIFLLLHLKQQLNTYVKNLNRKIPLFHDLSVSLH